jgi:hypothetical protein
MAAAVRMYRSQRKGSAPYCTGSRKCRPRGPAPSDRCPTIPISAVRLCQAQDVQIHLRDGERYRIAASYGFMPGHYEYTKEHPPPLTRGSALGRAVLEGRVVHIPDVVTDPEYTWHEAQTLGAFGPFSPFRSCERAFPRS